MLQQPTPTRSVGYSLEASCFSVSLREWGLQAAASKRMQLEYVPDVFLIQLKRVSYTAQGAVKLNKHVAFPNTLTLANGVWMAAQGRQPLSLTRLWSRVAVQACFTSL